MMIYYGIKNMGCNHKGCRDRLVFDEGENYFKMVAEGWREGRVEKFRKVISMADVCLYDYVRGGNKE